jgi:anthranilate phosphoribosyltransferase
LAYLVYGYLYQNTDKNFVILHALDGYDEISLTGGFKMIMKNKEEVYKPSDLGLKQLTEADLAGGDTVEDAAIIFKNVLENKGTEAQNHAVFANAGLAIATGKQISIIDGIAEAKESLVSGKALKSFKKFIEINS